MNPASHAVAPPADGLSSLTPLMQPRSVAVIGASANPTRIGGRPLRYLLESGYQGAVYAVNPSHAEVQGRRCYPSVDAIGAPVDVAIVALPAELTAAAVRDCAEHGVKAVIMFSAGFAETDEAGRARQEELARIARGAGMRLLGPNCLGAFDSAAGYFATFAQVFDGGGLRPGPISVASQSGAGGSYLVHLCMQRGIGVRHWVTTGNEADVELGECLLWLATSPNVQVVVGYAEAVRVGASLIEALKAARRQRKPVVMLKVGRSTIGARATASHTGALAGEDAVYDAVLRQHGACRADSLEQLLDVAQACAQGRLPHNRRLGIVTGSGGLGALAADVAEAQGLDVSPMPQAAQDRIKSLLPFAGAANPIDVTAQAVNDLSLLETALELALTEGDYGAILCILVSAPSVPAKADALLTMFSALRARFPGRVIALSFAAPASVVQRFEQAGLLVIEDVNRAVRALAALAGFARSFEAADVPAGPPALPAPPPDPQAAVMQPLDEHEAKRWLARHGIPAWPERRVSDAAGAARAAAELGGPVALKVASPDIAHKTEVGGVVLNLATPDAAGQAAQALLERVRAARPDARISGVLVSPMCRGGVETIIGVVRDPAFGPVVMFGLGGIHVEVMRDVAFRVAPIDEHEARAMVMDIRGAALLAGVRGAPPTDVDALAQALSRLSWFAWTHRDSVAEIDINPFVVMPQGQGAFALDALIAPGGPAPAADR